ncbi:hypothetical protein CIB84_014392 [Bambusicola thoracicus]|uniref:Uncharacterized protein n=1 Tax=Bambusicola thoracicus TaxID=9083 RepID=A0A2P4SCP7_BAMTH|nr:hypothetical protein CIB84_014392 [Bambusicola thoracicus]
MLPWLEQQLSHIQVLRWWQINWLKSMIMSHLCQVGLDRDTLVQCLQGMLGPITVPFTDIIITATQRLCGQDARSLLGLDDPSSAQKQEDSCEDPSTAQRQEDSLEDPSSAQEQEDSHEDPSTAQEQEDGPAAPSSPTAAHQGTTAPSAAPSGSSTSAYLSLPLAFMSSD